MPASPDWRQWFFPSLQNLPKLFGRVIKFRSHKLLSKDAARESDNLRICEYSGASLSGRRPGIYSPPPSPLEEIGHLRKSVLLIARPLQRTIRDSFFRNRYEIVGKVNHISFDCSISSCSLNRDKMPFK